MNKKIKQTLTVGDKTFISIPYRKDVIVSKPVTSKYINIKDLQSLEVIAPISKEIAVIEKAYKNKTPLNISIDKKVNGGWMVSYNSFPMFLPNSQFIFKVDPLPFKKYPLYIYNKAQYNGKTNYIVSKSPLGKDDVYATDVIKRVWKVGTPMNILTNCIFCSNFVIYKCFKGSELGYISYMSQKSDTLNIYYIVKELPEHIINYVRSAMISYTTDTNTLKVKLDGGYMFPYVDKNTFFDNLYSYLYHNPKNQLKVKVLSSSTAVQYSNKSILTEEYVKFLHLRRLIVTNNRKYIFKSKELNRYEFTTIVKNSVFKLTDGKLVIPTPEFKYKMVGKVIYLLSYYNVKSNKFIYKRFN